MTADRVIGLVAKNSANFGVLQVAGEWAAESILRTPLE